MKFSLCATMCGASIFRFRAVALPSPTQQPLFTLHLETKTSASVTPTTTQPRPDVLRAAHHGKALARIAILQSANAAQSLVTGEKSNFQFIIRLVRLPHRPPHRDCKISRCKSAYTDLVNSSTPMCTYQTVPLEFSIQAMRHLFRPHLIRPFAHLPSKLAKILPDSEMHDRG
jgi:hypothetical protein